MNSDSAAVTTEVVKSSKTKADHDRVNEELKAEHSTLSEEHSGEAGCQPGSTRADPKRSSRGSMDEFEADDLTHQSTTDVSPDEDIRNPGRSEIELPEEPGKGEETDQTPPGVTMGRVEDSADQTIQDEEKDKLISNLRSKVPSAIRNNSQPQGTENTATRPSKTAWSSGGKKKTESGHNRELGTVRREMRTFESDKELPGTLPASQAPPSRGQEPKSKSAAYFRNGDVRFPSGTEFSTGDKIDYRDRTFTLKPKAPDNKTVLLYGLLGLVIVLLAASQLVRRGDANPYPPLVGVVTDLETGQVLPDVKITINELGKSVMSNYSGLFVFEMVPEGSYTITGETPFFRTASLSFRHGKSNQTVLGIPMQGSKLAAVEKPPQNARPQTTQSEAKKYGNIKITTNVDNAQVFLDNKNYGSGSRTVKKVLEGKHKLVVDLDGYETFAQTVSVKNNKTSSIEATLVKVTEEKPPEQSAVDYVRIGDSAAAAGDLSGAIGNYTAALEREETAEVYYRRAQIYDKTGSPDEAAKDFMQAGNHFVSIGQLTAAIGAYNAALDLFPGDLKILRARGYTYVQKGEYDLAMADFRTACDLDGDSYLNRIGLGHVFSMTGKHKDAIKEYKRAGKLTENKSEVYALIALASLARGKEKDARKYYAKFLETATPDVQRKYASDPDWQRLKQLASTD
jgi:tetratricopeptide (TPR) repeat protein